MTAALTLVLAVIVACSGYDSNPTYPGVTPPPPPTPVLLKDVVIDRLPSPFYHFAYDATGRVAEVSYASGLDTDPAAFLSTR